LPGFQLKIEPANFEGLSLLDAALRLEEAELLPVHSVFEQDGRVIEARLFVDNIGWDSLPVIPVKIFPLVAAIVADAKARFEHVAVIAAGLERDVETLLRFRAQSLRLKPLLPFGTAIGVFSLPFAAGRGDDKQQREREDVPYDGHTKPPGLELSAITVARDCHTAALMRSQQNGDSILIFCFGSCAELTTINTPTKDLFCDI
jgi:hypothetical protein